MNDELYEPSDVLQTLADLYVNHVYKGKPGQATNPWIDWLKIKAPSTHDLPVMQLINAICRAQTPLRRRQWRDRKTA